MSTVTTTPTGGASAAPLQVYDPALLAQKKQYAAAIQAGASRPITTTSFTGLTV